MTREARFVAPEVTDASIDMLYAYRRHCAANSSPGQLILPESLKLLPLYLAVAGKLPAFGVNKPPSKSVVHLGEVTVRADARVIDLATLSALPAARLVPYMYPRVYRVDLLAPHHGVPLPPGTAGAPGAPADAPPPPPPVPAHTLTQEQLATVALPPVVYPSVEQLAPHATYLLDHRSGLYLIVGSESDEETFRDTFGGGVPTPSALPPGTPLPALDTDASMRLWTIISAVRARKPPHQGVSVVAPGDAPLRDFVGTLLAEDRVGSARSYVDLLCHVHTAIQGKMTTGA